jgi:hypothetical protein
MSRGGTNYHFDSMKVDQARLRIPAGHLHKDTGGELSKVQVIDWKQIYRAI